MERLEEALVLSPFEVGSEKDKAFFSSDLFAIYNRKLLNRQMNIRFNVRNLLEDKFVVGFKPYSNEGYYYPTPRKFIFSVGFELPATSTLGGTRLKRELRDVAPQIDVMTSGFLDDIGALTLDEARYSMKIESSDENFSPGTDANTNNVFSSAYGSRTRGLSRSNNTHDFFETNVPLDTYNNDTSGMRPTLRRTSIGIERWRQIRDGPSGRVAATLGNGRHRGVGGPADCGRVPGRFPAVFLESPPRHGGSERQQPFAAGRRSVEEPSG